MERPAESEHVRDNLRPVKDAEHKELPEKNGFWKKCWKSTHSLNYKNGKYVWVKPCLDLDIDSHQLSRSASVHSSSISRYLPF